MIITRCILMGVMVVVGSNARAAEAPRRASTAADVEAVLRGPLHEAFARPVIVPAAPGLAVAEAPPKDLREHSPRQGPENAIWIPGYWAWGEGQWMWVSGIWRIPPPAASRWVPGYWAASGDGYRWVSGFWSADARSPQDWTYLPAPPSGKDSGEHAKNSESQKSGPGANYFWVPSEWVWSQGEYVRREGRWQRSRSGRVWIAGHLIWTPLGYLPVKGYWDYPLQERGLAFADLVFRRPVHQESSFVYSPEVVLNPSLLTRHLFVRPGYGHYYFGDWYGEESSAEGILPWFAYHDRSPQDLLYSYYNAAGVGSGVNFDEEQYNRFRRLREHPEQRPPASVAQERRLAKSDNRSREAVLALALDELAEKRPELNLQPFNRAEREATSKVGANYPRLARQRADRETRTKRDLEAPPRASTASRARADSHEGLRQAIVRRAEEREAESEEEAAIVLEGPTEMLPEMQTIPGADHYAPSSSSRQRLTDNAWEQVRRSGQRPRVRVDDQDFLPGVKEHLLDTPSESAVPGN